MDSSTHSPPLPLPLPPAYTTDTQETFDKDDVELDLDPGLPALPPGLGGFGTSAGATEQLPEQSGTPLRILVPIPTVSSAADSISFAFPDPTATMDGELSILSKPLPQESEADVVIAPDSTYVETSSAPWAMELKRRYDTLYGVNVIVRSPYAITAFVGQHGQKRYRIGHRELSAPGATAAAAEDILVLSNLSKQSKSPPPQTSPQSSKVGIGVGGGRSKSNSIRSPSGSITKPASKASLNSLEISSSRPSHKSQSFSRASKSGKRHSRGRISINALLGSGSASSPSTSAVGSTPRKLKKPRSNPDLSLSSPSGDPGYGYSGYGYTYGYGQHPPSAYNSTGTTVFGGRMHSLSVTATDMPHVVGIDPANPPLIPSSSLFPNPTHITTPPTKLPERKGDSFGEIMGWRNHLIPSHMTGTSSGFSTSAPSTGYVAHSTHNFSATGSGFVPRPFGPGVHFETPAILQSDYGRFLKVQNSPWAHRRLKEMQSFESGLTATPIPPVTPTLAGTSTHSSNLEPSDDTTHSLIDDIHKVPGSGVNDIESRSQPDFSTPQTPQTPRVQMYSPSGLPPRLAKFATYSTEIFDVLQTSRGLPRLDLLDLRLSLSQDGSAAPKDDPRFVIWGEVTPSETSGLTGCDASSVSHESSTSTNSSMSISLGVKGKGRASDFQFTVGHGVNGSASATLSEDGSGKTRVLLAATIERWLAQLTSDLDYDELLNFFLTYRTYISALDLARLLMTRFCWALGRSIAVSSLSNTVRRIVRVRTFVAFKYWLITFFTVDFVPNRELRLYVANHLNDLAKELGDLGREADIVKKLKNVAKDCKKLYTRNNTVASSSRTQNSNKNSQPPSDSRKDVRTTRKLSAASALTILDTDDSDVDLDFIDEPSSTSSPYSGVYGKTPVNNVHLGGASTLNLSTAISPPGPGSIPLSSFSILQRTDHAPGPEFSSGPMYSSSMNANATTIPHNALSRVLVKTLGRLGRWKRVLNSGGGFSRMATACADVSAFDVELTVDSSDLLSSSGGVESYLRLVEAHLPSSALPRSAPDDHIMSLPASDQSSEPPEAPQNRDSIAETESDYGAVTNVHELRDSLIPSPRANEESFNDVSQGRESRATRRSSRTSSTGSFGEPLSASRASARFPAFTSPWQFDVVSLDDLSDNSSDEHDNANRSRDAPGDLPGLRRPPRRLPLRREFEFLERPETVSSMGIISRSSIVSASSASGQSTASHTSSSSAAGGLGAGIQQWQMNALKDSLMDDEEPGDVDEALKRLEGQINPQKRLEKASKVNGWVKTIRERLAAGDYSDEEPMYSDDDDDDAEVEPHEGSEDSFSRSAQGTESTSATMLASTDIPPPDADSVTATTPVVEQIDQVASPARSTDSKPAVEDAVPLEIRQSRLSSELPSVTPERISKFVDPSIGPKVAHRSFVLLFKAEDLAQHFAMIDRELFMTIKFEELLLEDWMYCEEVDTLDWAQFLKDRARWKAEARLPEKTSALGAVRARFNLMVNFTVSEIVLTNQAERLYVFSKFLRIAWKSYQRNSFNTLVAIMTGLQSSWVTRAMRRSMNKLSIWDKRMLADLKLFTSREDNFRHIRCAVDAINDAKPFEATSLASSVVSAVADSVNDQPTPSACIPFVGTYLSQLYQHNQLPVLVDPTAPNEVVMVDPVSPNFSSPAHPEVFSTLAPLPSSMHLEPLINVHRQRLIAAVIKSLVAGQHLASRAQFPIDKKLFHKCLRIRGLDSNTLHRALALKSP
ncbi:hypothetical protein F5879DRAFT_809828 [Lentinula edodes]|nr:hypothetical protein F5879DRAFT_809828 [Lentinula edodes]